MNILLTNDDGWGAKGLNTLIDVMRRFGDVTVVAPDGPRSGQSNAISVLQPVRLRLLKQEPGLTVYTSNGTPSDCIKLGLHIIFRDRQPDLICSGINHGDNGTINVIYSGTMGAVFVGCEHGIPSIGWSLCDHNPQADFSYFEPWIEQLTKHILSLPPKAGLCWNINAPVGPIAGWEYTRQGRGYWDKEWQEYHDPTGQPFYMLTGEFVSTEQDPTGTDHYANAHGRIAVTPTTIDTTDYEALRSL